MPTKKPTIDGWGNRKGKPWADIDIQCALFLRHCGLDNADIAAILRRSEKSVEYKLGYVRTARHHAVTFEAARLVAAKALGHAADSHIQQTVGTA